MSPKHGLAVLAVHQLFQALRDRIFVQRQHQFVIRVRRLGRGQEVERPVIVEIMQAGRYSGTSRRGRRRPERGGRKAHGARQDAEERAERDSCHGLLLRQRGYLLRHARNVGIFANCRLLNPLVESILKRPL